MGPDRTQIIRQYLDQINEPDVEAKALGYIDAVFQGRDVPCFLGLAVVSERLLRQGHGPPVLAEVPPEDMITGLYGRTFEEIDFSFLKHELRVNRDLGIAPSA